jgi:CAAX prenyl protease-like protein
VPWLARDGVGVAAPGASYPAAPYLVPFLAAVAAGLVVGAFSSPGREPLYALKPALALVALAAYWPVYRSPAWRDTWRVSWFAPVVGAVVGALWIALGAAWPSGAVTAAPASRLVGALRAVTTVLLVPLTEELAFRGFLARRASTPAFDALPPQRLTVAGVAASSLAFGLLHARPVSGFVAGLGYALAYRARGRLGDAVVAHAATNALLAVAAAWLGVAVNP